MPLRAHRSNCFLAPCKEAPSMHYALIIATVTVAVALVADLAGLWLWRD